MSRLSDYQTGRVGEVHRASDVTTLQTMIPEIRHLPPQLVERMYSDFSDSYAANWLIINEEIIQEFRGWLLD